MRILLAVLISALVALAGPATALAYEDLSGMNKAELWRFLGLNENGKTPEKLKKRAIRNGCGGHAGCHLWGLGYIEDNPNKVIDEIVLRACRKIATHERFGFAMQIQVKAGEVNNCIYRGLQTASGRVESAKQCKGISREKYYDEQQMCFMMEYYFYLTTFCDEKHHKNGRKLKCLVQNTIVSIETNGGDLRWLN